MYCHYHELEFLKPVMQERQTDNNFTSESEDDLLSENRESNTPSDIQRVEEDVDDPDTPEPTRRITTRAKNVKKKHSQDFIDVVRNLIDGHKSENNEIAAFTKSLIPQMAEVRKDLQCDLRIDIMKIIKSYQLKSNAHSARGQPLENMSQPILQNNQWEESGFRPFSSNTNPQFNQRFPAPYDLPTNYYPDHRHPPPHPPPPSTPQPNNSRDDINSHLYYHDL
ncbi:uncharacterized protein LOC120935929 [Rana temporaria]|uniref:uncharacterized protein LOC120935929 n=1 Tax=Rana temporaria TaxID=8407 RepID=UPI001AAD1936|nr:uncharacterized protein LOC120935929 [Rana temporaria]